MSSERSVSWTHCDSELLECLRVQFNVARMKAPAAAFEQASWEVKSGRTWAPAAREGHICAYSRSIGGIVVFGGLTPGAAHSADCSICRITAATGDETSIEWQPVPLRNPSGGGVKIPRRCYHGAELRDGADGKAQLIIFGGEGVLCAAPSSVVCGFLSTFYLTTSRSSTI